MYQSSTIVLYTTVTKRFADASCFCCLVVAFVVFKQQTAVTHVKPVTCTAYDDDGANVKAVATRVVVKVVGKVRAKVRKPIVIIIIIKKKMCEYNNDK